MGSHGSLNTVRGSKRDRHPDVESDTRRIRRVDVDRFAREVIAEACDPDGWSDLAASLVDPTGWDRYAR